MIQLHEFSVVVTDSAYCKAHPSDEFDRYYRKAPESDKDESVPEFTIFRASEEEVPKGFRVVAVDGERRVLPEPVADVAPPSTAISQSRPVLVALACSRLDDSNSEHWTQTGIPKIEALMELCPEAGDISRDEVKLYAPWCLRNRTP